MATLLCWIVKSIPTPLSLIAIVDVKTVSARLGHDSVQTTLELYAHVTPKMRANAAVRFGSLLNHARLASVDETAGSQA